MASAHVGSPGIMDRPQGHRRPESGQGPFPGPSVVFRLHCPLVCDALHKAAGLTGGCVPAVLHPFPVNPELRRLQDQADFPATLHLWGGFSAALHQPVFQTFKSEFSVLFLK